MVTPSHSMQESFWLNFFFTTTYWQSTHIATEKLPSLFVFVLFDFAVIYKQDTKLPKLLGLRQTVTLKTALNIQFLNKEDSKKKFLSVTVLFRMSLIFTVKKYVTTSESIISIRHTFLHTSWETKLKNVKQTQTFSCNSCTCFISHG